MLSWPRAPAQATPALAPALTPAQRQPRPANPSLDTAPPTMFLFRSCLPKQPGHIPKRPRPASRRRARPPPGPERPHHHGRRPRPPPARPSRRPGASPARTAHPRAQPAPPPHRCPCRHPPSSASPPPSARVARAVRRCVALARSLDEPVKPAQDPARRRAAARRRIIREVEDAIHRAAHDGDRAESLQAELRDRLDAPDLDDDIAARPLAEIVTEIRRDLGLASLPGDNPWKRRTPADIAQLNARAAARATPLAAPPMPPTGPVTRTTPGRAPPSTRHRIPRQPPQSQQLQPRPQSRPTPPPPPAQGLPPRKPAAPCRTARPKPSPSSCATPPSGTRRPGPKGNAPSVRTGDAAGPHAPAPPTPSAPPVSSAPPAASRMPGRASLPSVPPAPPPPSRRLRPAASAPFLTHHEPDAPGPRRPRPV